ncbi:MAG: nidogen-like domain-containing protein [Gemmatirosa sp.]
MARPTLRRTRWCLAAFALAGVPALLPAQAIRTNAGFAANTLARNDDQSTGQVALGFGFNFFGLLGNQAYVNNNGNITFDQSLSTFTPFPLLNTNRQIIAPFFADIDTSNPASGVTQYGTDVVNGRAAFGVNWLGVGYFASMADKLNTFQLILIDRSDIATGDFDFEFNYAGIQFESGGASGDNSPNNGICQPQEADCVPARAGWSNGNVSSFELAGSGVRGALLDGGPNALVAGSLNSNVTGRYVFNVRGGQVQPPQDPGTPTVVPEPSTYLLLASGLLGLAGVARGRGRRRSS